MKVSNRYIFNDFKFENLLHKISYYIGFNIRILEDIFTKHKAIFAYIKSNKYTQS